MLKGRGRGEGDTLHARALGLRRAAPLPHHPRTAVTVPQPGQVGVFQRGAGVPRLSAHPFFLPSSDELETPSLDAATALEFPELHTDAAPLVAFLDAAATLAAAAGVPDFGLADLARPDPSRTRATLSALINYGRYREARLAEWEAAAAPVAALDARAEELEAERAALTAEAAALDAARAAEAARAADVAEGAARVADENADMNARQASEADRVRGLKHAADAARARAPTRLPTQLMLRPPNATGWLRSSFPTPTN